MACNKHDLELERSILLDQINKENPVAKVVKLGKDGEVVYSAFLHDENGELIGVIFEVPINEHKGSWRVKEESKNLIQWLKL